MIAGLGLDLVEIDRVTEALSRNGRGFAERILHADEDRDRAMTPGGAVYLAGQFAAKEAVMKALGTGMAGAAFREIVVLRDPRGAPVVRLEGGAAERAARLGISSWRVSITHSKVTAAAVAIGMTSAP